MDELYIMNEAGRLIKGERKEFLKNERNEKFNKIEADYDYEHIGNEIDNCIHRYSIRCLTGNGPFRSFLNKI